MGGAARYTFALPPSLGREPVRILALRFADVLYSAGFTTVFPAKNYEQLEEVLQSGEAHAAWGPPIICARVEQAGGSVLLQAVRNGGLTYRSVILCRSNHNLDFKRLGVVGGRKLRAVWVDSRSMGGCILARHHLRSQGVDLAAAFAEEEMLGSYQDCFEAVLSYKADLTASFANRQGLGFVELCGDRAMELRQLAYTEESPNDGVVLSPHLSPEQATVLASRLRELFARQRALDLLATMFNVTGFAEPPPRTYERLLSLL
jgi:phosphonate transport system substrate-binding protein